MEFNERQHVPVARYQDNMGQIIERFIELGVNSDQIIVISPPPVDEKVKTFCLLFVLFIN